MTAFALVLMIAIAAMIALCFCLMQDFYVKTRCVNPNSHKDGVRCRYCGFKGLTISQRYQRWGDSRD